MTTTTVTLRFYVGDRESRLEVRAYATASPELVVHRRIAGDGTPAASGWDVTHRRSGMRVAPRPMGSNWDSGYPTRKAALAAAAALAGLDWSVVDDAGKARERRAMERLGAACDRALDEIAS